MSDLTLKELQEAAINYNDTHSDFIDITDNKEDMKKKVIKKIEEEGCKIDTNKKCWVNSNVFMDLYGRPNGPLKFGVWLSNTDIDKTLKMREKLFKNFKYVKTVACDFMDYSNSFKKERLFEKGKDYYAFVVNTGTLSSGGQHWTAVFIDTKNKKFYYYDPVGNKTKKEVPQYIRNYAKYLGFKKIYYNIIKHQYDKSECGVFSIRFILYMLNGYTFEKFAKDNIKTQKIASCRLQYFNKK